MKILCVVGNYANPDSSAAQPDAEPAFFLKPDSALLQRRNPFFYPDFSSELEPEVELVVRIDKVGKTIEERFAHRYYSHVAVGLDFSARDWERRLRAQGMPWTIAKGFDDSAVLSEFVSLDELGKPINDVDFALFNNGVEVVRANTSQMLRSVDALIHEISQFMTLKTGDLLFTGSPWAPCKVQIGDLLEASIEGHNMLSCPIK